MAGFAAPGRVCDGVVMAWIELDGAVNVRDLGDMPTEDGQKTARASLLRADSLQDLSAADVRKLVHDIGVTTVVDLRSSNELAAEGPAPLDAVAGVRHAHHPVLPEVGSATDVIADALLARDRMDKFRYPRDPVCGHYLGYLEDRPDQVVGALRSVAHAGGAAVVHCAAGKDRTGVVVALALTVAGVPAEAVVADYAATGERTEAIMARLRRSRLYSRDVNSKPADLQRASGRDDGGVPRADGRAVRRGRVVADRSRPVSRRPGRAAGQAPGRRLSGNGGARRSSTLRSAALPAMTETSQGTLAASSRCRAARSSEVASGTGGAAGVS